MVQGCAIFSMNCYVSPESVKMNNDDTFFSKEEKEQGVTDLVVEKGSEQNALYTALTLKMRLNCFNNNCPHIIIWLVGIYKKKPHSLLGPHMAAPSHKMQMVCFLS